MSPCVLAPPSAAPSAAWPRPWRWSRTRRPGLAEEGEGAEHGGDVKDGVDRVSQHRAQRLRRRQVVAETANGVGAAAAGGIPDAKQVDDEVAGELDAEHLRDHVEVGDEGTLQDDRDVAGVEQLDGVAAVLAAVTGRLDRQVDTEALEVDDAEDQDRSTEVHQVGKILAVEGLPESVDLVLAGGEQEEQGDEGAVACVEGGRGEALPDDRLADVGGDEEGDAGAEAVALLEQLVQEEDDCLLYTSDAADE